MSTIDQQMAALEVMLKNHELKRGRRSRELAALHRVASGTADVGDAKFLAEALGYPEFMKEERYEI